MAHKYQEILLTELDKLKQRISIGDKFCHYKHPEQFYLIIALGFIEATEEPAVIYEADYGEKFVWVRSQEDFFAKVKLEDGVEVDRFTKVE